MDSISAGLISARGEVVLPPNSDVCKLELFKKTPSIIYKGSLLELIDVVPLKRTKMDSPGTPEFVITCNPGAFPCNCASKLATGILLTSDAFILATEPTKSCLF